MMQNTFMQLLPALPPVGQAIKLVIILRGPPGCGKTTLANNIVGHFTQHNYTSTVCTPLSLFIDKSWNPADQWEANSFCCSQLSQALAAATDVVVVDNTHMRIHEYQPMLDMIMLRSPILQYLFVIVDVRVQQVEGVNISHLLEARTMHRNVNNHHIVTLMRSFQTDVRSITVTGDVDADHVQQAIVKASTPPPTPSPKQKKQPVRDKVPVCRHWLEGKCRFGDKCHYSHQV